MLEQHAAGGLFTAAYEPFETTVFIELIDPDVIRTDGGRLGKDNDAPEPWQELLDCLKRAEQIRCPNLCGLIECFDADGFLGIASEYAAGITLRELLDDVGSLPLPQALEVIGACVEAAGAAYGCGIYYLAFDPRNLLITASGPVKLRRGGYYHALEANDAILRHEALLYRAPEALRGRPSRASDVYSMAVMLSEMLGSSRPQPLEAILVQATTPESTARPAARPWLEALVEEAGRMERPSRTDIVSHGQPEPTIFPRGEPRPVRLEGRPVIRRYLVALALLLLAAYLAARFIGCRPAGHGLSNPAAPASVIAMSAQEPWSALRTASRDT